MNHHQHRTIERHCDVCIIGGSGVALTSALAYATSGQAVIVIDSEGTGDHDGQREQVRRHGGEVLAARAVDLGEADGGFRVELTGGHAVLARRVVTDPVAVAATDLDLGDDDLGPSANQRDWDRRYSDRRMWSGNPNGTLVAEARRLTPGRALDVGAGEGGDAIWLAEQGWQVVASDIAQPALDRIAAEADRRGLRLECLRVDANARDAFSGIDGFGLVSAQYASIPRTPDDRGVRNLMDAVAPGGTLLVVGHDLAPMRAPIDTRTESRIFDPDAYVRVEDFARTLNDEERWTIELHESRPRPAGAATSHHVDDIVLRARRATEG